ncbi:hypothetical protein [Actinomadura rubrisoli]|uniref:Uncharacterized protein n=1 Tax=Actinomadura rubrisoli TaxID=2530368 RepID=A0A4R5CE31_9ACTN|nr:hypothetical protein [Actinomadura rubrisoli]TDD97166.1 hypothetical protein E1298_01655 [Actinomadura rubrisoli]
MAEENEGVKPEDQDVDWQAHARTWEDRAKKNLAELNAAKAEAEALKAQTQEWETKYSSAQTLADEAKAKATADLRDEYLARIARIRFENAFQTKGRELPDNFDELVNISKFVDAEKGDVNLDLVTQFVEAVSPGDSTAPKFDQSFNSGPVGGQAPEPDYSPEAIAQRILDRSPFNQ